MRKYVCCSPPNSSRKCVAGSNWWLLFDRIQLPKSDQCIANIVFINEFRLLARRKYSSTHLISDQFMEQNSRSKKISFICLIALCSCDPERANSHLHARRGRIGGGDVDQTHTFYISCTVRYMANPRSRMSDLHAFLHVFFFLWGCKSLVFHDIGTSLWPTIFSCTSYFHWKYVGKNVLSWNATYRTVILVTVLWQYITTEFWLLKRYMNAWEQ